MNLDHMALAVLLGLLVLAYAVFVAALPLILRSMSQRQKSLELWLGALERRQRALEERLAAGERAPPPAGATGVEQAAEPEAPPDDPSPAAPSPPEPSPEPPTGTPAGPAPVSGAPAAAAPPPPARAAPDLVARVRAWLLGGNTFARLGVLVLFFGVAFLLKFAVERGLVPIELRLAGAALGGLLLLVIGWRLRAERRAYALALQGGGAGIVYLTVFAAIVMYDLLAPAPGMALMVVLVLLAAALAVLQDARSLAVLAAVGGFLAPVLVSSGGSHVTLFSYYLALDAGVLGIAWFRPWRELNLVGFAFTFVIGALWGWRFYRPEHFASTEPFLIAFFVFYVAVPILYARRGPIELKGYVDGTLVFGVPLIAAALQAALVRELEYGLAWSALGAGLFYAVLATGLWRAAGAPLRMLVEAFLALAVAFGTLAIPFAVDGRFTSAAWALEGAALVWVGVRQRRALARAFGLAVQVGAGMVFLKDIGAPAADVPVLNSAFLGAAMVSVAGLFSAFYLHRHRARLFPLDRDAAVGVFGWGLAWWLGAGLREIVEHAAPADRLHAALVLVAASMAAAGWLRRRLAWDHMTWPPLGLLPVMALIALGMLETPLIAHPLERWGLIAWIAAFAAMYALLWRFENEWARPVVHAGHLGGLWLAVALIAWEGWWWLDRALPEATTWGYVAWGVIPALFVVAVPALVHRLAWPLARFRTQYLGAGLAPLVAFLGLWCLHASLQAGRPDPLPYVTVLNPLELVQLFALAIALRWSGTAPLPIAPRPRWYAWAAVAFVVLNGIVARATHFYGDVPFDAGWLWAAERFQTALSITWTVAALTITVLATRLARREMWIAGAALIGAVVLKLFAVDLAGVGTVARIVSFLVVGALILIIGYLSPLPPRTGREGAQA